MIVLTLLHQFYLGYICILVKFLSSLQIIYFLGAVDLWSQLCKRENNLDSSFVLENFQEACQAVNTAVLPTTVSLFPADVFSKSCL